MNLTEFADISKPSVFPELAADRLLPIGAAQLVKQPILIHRAAVREGIHPVSEGARRSQWGFFGETFHSGASERLRSTVRRHYFGRIHDDDKYKVMSSQMHHQENENV